MSIAKFTKAVNIIASLGDNPNTDNNLSAAELKAKFDEAPELIKEYLNGTLVPAVQALQNAPMNAWVAHEEEFDQSLYRKVGREQEWLNPPMMEGKAYRTAERFSDSAVYVGTTGFYISEDSAGFEVLSERFGISAADTILAIHGVAKDGATVFGIPGSNHGGPIITPVVESDTGAVVLYYDAGCDGIEVTVFLKWIKG